MSPIFEYPTSENRYSAATADQQATIKNEFGRLIHAAIINRNFREKLLLNPLQSIEHGYCGESFQFNKEIKDRIRCIKATTLEEFSTELLRMVSSPVVREVVIAHYQ
jgi:hypothetical protein